jgi:Txe/YoeB family toxin of toxin-antitoxin system
MTWTIEFSRNALKDVKKLKAAHLETNVKNLLAILKNDPYQPPYEKLSGNLSGYYSRRINIKHRLVYSIDEARKLIRVVSIRAHYE